MSPRFARLGALAFLLTAVPAHAQSRGRVDLGGFLQWTVFDESLRMDDFFATGGRVGIPLGSRMSLEADASRVATNGPPGIEVTYVPIHARVTYGVPVRQGTTLIAGLGYVHNVYGGARDGSDDGAGALLGLRFGLSRLWSLRLDALADYMPSPANGPAGAAHNWNFGLRQGLNLTLGGKPDVAPADPVPSAPSERAAASAGSDQDGDGVADTADRCPDTPAGQPVDAAGCPLDRDRDGVPDAGDRCPDTPAGTPVDASGCVLDGDHDGVPDMLDRCAGTAPGTAVDAAGCPLDSDGDRVPDALDRCPDTPAGTRTDAAGCLVLFEENRKSVILEGVNFANGKAELTPESKAILDNVAASLVANPDFRVAVDGHTSSTGSRPLNLRLSRARAEAVREYLIDRGVGGERLVARGFGPDRPIASNTTAEGQAKNRRTELSKLD